MSEALQLAITALAIVAATGYLTRSGIRFLASFRGGSGGASRVGSGGPSGSSCGGSCGCAGGGRAKRPSGRLVRLEPSRR